MTASERLIARWAAEKHFSDMPNRYIANIHRAVREWIDNHPDMQGTSVFEQMKDIAARANREYQEYRL